MRLPPFLAASALALLLWSGAQAADTRPTPTPTEWVRGTVVRLDPARSRVTLNHERVKSIKMQAMTMPFKVASAQQLVPLKLGDKVRFEVVAKDDELLITHIEVAP